MKTNLILHVGSIFSLSTLNLIAGAAALVSHNDMQHPLTKNQTITMPGAESSEQGVPGHNDAFYGPVPKAEQIFDIEFLEIAPSPIPVSKYFFILLRGEITPSTRQKLHLEPANLSDATLSITVSAVFEKKKGGEFKPRTFVIPLRTAELAEGAHLGIRNATGAYVDHMALEGRHDILTDYWIPGPFVQTGTWTFAIEASLGGGGKEGICLFALTLTQWLEGEEGW